MRTHNEDIKTIYTSYFEKLKPLATKIDESKRLINHIEDEELRNKLVLHNNSVIEELKKFADHISSTGVKLIRSHK